MSPLWKHRIIHKLLFDRFLGVPNINVSAFDRGLSYTSSRRLLSNM